MGIDIYAKWRAQSEQEKKKQITGFSVTSGDAGYLREAYHGGPYVTKYLVGEAFENGKAKIPAKVMRERLPQAILMSLFREKKIYGKGDPSVKDIAEMPAVLADVFATKMKDDSHQEFVANLTPASIDYAKLLLDSRKLPDYAKSFVDFVELCEWKEAEIGEPCEIIASY